MHPALDTRGKMQRPGAHKGARQVQHRQNPQTASATQKRPSASAQLVSRPNPWSSSDSRRSQRHTPRDTTGQHHAHSGPCMRAEACMQPPPSLRTCMHGARWCARWQWCAQKGGGLWTSSSTAGAALFLVRKQNGAVGGATLAGGPKRVRGRSGNRAASSLCGRCWEWLA